MKSCDTGATLDHNQPSFEKVKYAHTESGFYSEMFCSEVLWILMFFRGYKRVSLFYT